MNGRLKKIVYTAVGIALFTVLTLCLQVPVFQNYYLCLGYIAMAVYCYSVGPLSGMAVGCFGVVLYCLLTNGLRGMPGWALGNLAIGFGMGMISKRIKSTERKTIRFGLWILAAALSTAAGILVIKSLVDSIIRSQPFFARVAMNVYAFAADLAVLIIALPICEKLDELVREKL